MEPVEKDEPRTFSIKVTKAMTPDIVAKEALSLLQQTRRI